MNNDTNNEINGTVLGSVDSNLNSINYNNANNVSEEVETLDVLQTNENLNSSQQNTFFTNPPVNDVVVNNNAEATSNVVNEPQQPMPAYTNPQNINPMPGFESSNNIGTMPPISLEKEKKPKKKGGKIIFIILVLLALAGVGFGTYYVLEYTDLLTKREDSIKIEAKNLEIDIGDELSTDINDYASITGTDTKNCSLDKSLVDTNVAGEYEFIVKCGEISKTGKIVVVDNQELLVETKNVYKTKGETVEAKEFIENIDENLTYEFVEQDTINNILEGEKGSYKVKINVSNGNKSVEVEGTIVILEYPIRGYLTCTSSEVDVDGTTAKMTISEKFAILNDGNNGFGGITEEVHTFKFSDETEYANYLATYKTSNQITINNVTGSATFDDETFTIVIVNNRDSKSVINEYGADNMKDYGNIRSYFVNTMKYSCKWNPIG